MSLEERMDAYFEGNIKKFNAITARAINEINAHIEQGNFKSARICCEHEINVMRELIDERMEQEVLEHYRAHLNKIEKLRNEIIAQKSNNDLTKPQAKNNTNMTKDINALQKLAAQGNAKAQYRLGDCYSIGLGVAKDESLSEYWYRKSAEQGNAKGQASLGLCYLYDDDGNVKDLQQAEFWIRKSVAQGDILGQACLGMYYLALSGEEDNEEYAEEGFSLLTEAAEQGEPFGQAMLGTLYEGAENTEEAIYWYEKAVEQGNEFAIKAIEENSKIYTPANKTAKPTNTPQVNTIDKAAVEKLLYSLSRKKEDLSFQFTYPISEVDETFVRNNFCIPDEDKIYIVRDDGFFQGSDQGLVVSSSGITYLPDNDKPNEMTRIKWTAIRNIKYGKYSCLEFFDYYSEYPTLIPITIFCKPQNYKEDCPRIGAFLVKAFTEIAQVASSKVQDGKIAPKVMTNKGEIFVDELKERAESGDIAAVIGLEDEATEGNWYAKQYLKENRHSLPKITKKEREAYLAESEESKETEKCPKCDSRDTYSESSTTGNIVDGACQVVGRGGGFWGGLIGGAAGLAAKAIFTNNICNICKHEWK